MCCKLQILMEENKEINGQLSMLTDGKNQHSKGKSSLFNLICRLNATALKIPAVSIDIDNSVLKLISKGTGLNVKLILKKENKAVENKLLNLRPNI